MTSSNRFVPFLSHLWPFFFFFFLMKMKFLLISYFLCVVRFSRRDEEIHFQGVLILKGGLECSATRVVLTWLRKLIALNHL
jgi:hypothetical protein